MTTILGTGDKKQKHGRGCSLVAECLQAWARPWVPPLVLQKKNKWQTAYLQRVQASQSVMAQLDKYWARTRHKVLWKHSGSLGRLSVLAWCSSWISKDCKELARCRSIRKKIIGRNCICETGDSKRSSMHRTRLFVECLWELQKRIEVDRGPVLKLLLDRQKSLSFVLNYEWIYFLRSSLVAIWGVQFRDSCNPHRKLSLKWSCKCIVMDGFKQYFRDRICYIWRCVCMHHRERMQEKDNGYDKKDEPSGDFWFSGFHHWWHQWFREYRKMCIWK